MDYLQEYMDHPSEDRATSAEFIAWLRQHDARVIRELADMDHFSKTINGYEFLAYLERRAREIEIGDKP